MTAIYDGVQESLFDKSKELVLNDTNVNNSIIELNIEFDANALNKRITGINVYRATEFANTTSFDGYSNYQLIGHMTFVDTQESIPTISSSVNARLHVWRKDQVFLKSIHNLTGYDGETLGTNKYALDVDGGWDGIDEVTDWAGPPANGTSDELQWTVYHSPLNRPMNASQGYMIVSALAKDNTLANADKCEIENESIVINNVASTYDNTGFTATVPSGSGSLTFNMSSAVEGYFAVNDKIKTVASPSLAGTTYWTINSVGTGVSTEITATRNDGGSTTGASGVAIYMQEPASGVLVGIDRHGLGSPSATVTWLDNTTNSTPATHAVNSGIFIRAQSLPRSYSQANLDSDASMSDSYLDNGVMVGSDWKIEERSGFSYSTSVTSTSGGAYGGPRIGFLFFKNPDDITGTLGTDTTGNLLTAGSYAGSIMLLQGDESFEIENNSAYEPTLGGCWVKLNEKHNEFGVTGDGSDIIDESPAGHIKDNVRVISGFKQTNAQGATTPGMAFEVTSGTNVRVLCQDYRLEDLGETDVQTVYSNRVNAQYAVKLKGRMFMGNLYLNPEDKAEDHPDWIAYSELNQYDVRPVSNVVTLDDREGGAVTGLAVLFGRLIIFKPQAIFIMNVSDPADPNTWSISESKFSIGNIAPEGVVEVHDSVYFVFHDGIYAVTSNTVADSTKTPSVMDKISLSIEDQFLLANSKKDIKGVYSQKDSEVLYSWEEGLQYFYLNGTSSYLYDTSVTNMPSGFGITLSAWFKTDSNDSQTILGLYDSGSTNNYLSIGVLGGSVVAWHYSGSGSVIAPVGSGYNDNEWHHVAVTFDSSASRKIYVDGSLVSTNTSSSAFPTSLDTLSVGRHADSSPDNYFKGSIVGCHVFNTSLTATEVGSLKTIDKSSSISGHSRFSNCIASYLMGHGSGDTTTTVQDQTSNNNDLTGTEITQTTTQVTWAYHIILKTWRKINTFSNLDILAYGENSYPIAWDNTDTDIKKFDVDEAVGTTWKSKRFRLDLDQKRLIRYGMVKFTGTDTLTVNIYLDGSGSVSFTKSITADGGVNRFPIKRYGKNFEIELTTPSSTNSFSVEQMRIETE